MAGRAVLAGYAGWLSSHGLDYGKRFSEMNMIMSGSGSAYKWLKHYNVTHITVPWEHRKKFNVEFLNAIGSRVTSNGRYTVFEISRDELDREPQPCANGQHNTEAACRESGCMWLSGFIGVKCQAAHSSAVGETPIDCAKPGEGVSEDVCHDRWCAWYPKIKGPWCQQSSHSGRHKPFRPMDILTPDYDCGWHGMDVQQCVDRGCTWEAAGSNPWCTYRGPNKKSADQVSIIEPLS